MSILSTRSLWTQAFCILIPFWQEVRISSTGGLQALNYSSNIGAGSCSYTKNTAVVRPSRSDFAVDIELAARRHLNPEEWAYFARYYRDGNMALDEVPAHMIDFDRALREKLGRYFMRIKMYPLSTYRRSVDTRGARQLTRR